MKVFVTGVKGQLGYEVVKELEKRGLEAIGVDIEEMDITNALDVDKVICEANPDAVIHCAAYTAVDAAEDNEDLCRKINVMGTEYIAQCCQEQNCKLIYLSTDYVFNGEGNFEQLNQKYPIIAQDLKALITEVIHQKKAKEEK